MISRDKKNGNDGELQYIPEDARGVLIISMGYPGEQCA